VKIAIAAPSPVPFLVGGAERVWSGLARAIEHQTAHDVELVKLPSPERNLPEVVASYEQFWQLDLGHFDLVITGKYPAWMVRHPNHVVYMLHPLRGLYDTYPAGFAEEATPREPDILQLVALLAAPPDSARVDEVFSRFRELLMRHGPDHPAFTFPGPLARRIVRHLDSVALQPGHVRKHAAISKTVAGRSGYFPPGVEVRVVYPPSDLEGYRCDEFDYFFSAGRLDHPKRVDLLIEAMRLYRGQLRLVVAGTGPDEARLRMASQDDARIGFVGRASSDELIDLYARSRAVLFVPKDEDLGLITIEAMSSSKPVITTHDSGGPTELVEHEVTGLIVKPEPASIAAAMERLAHDVELCRVMGAAGRTRASSISWANVIDVLVGNPDNPASSQQPRPPSEVVARRLVASDRAWRRPNHPKLVVASTFPAYPRMGGGQLRVFGLYGALKSLDIEIVSMDRTGAPGRMVTYRQGFIERSIAKSESQMSFEAAESTSAGVLVSDVVASEAATRTPQYREAMLSALRDADGVLLAHPYMYGFVDQLGTSLPLIYDSPDAEFRLKAGVFAGSKHAEALLQRTEGIEAAALRDASLITVCSREDADALSSHYHIDAERILVIPNGVDVARIEFVNGEDRAAQRKQWLQLIGAGGGRARQDVAIFLASWHPPNVEAAQCIIDFAPRLPDVLFLLVGSHCEAFRRRTVPANIRLMGSVSEDAKRSLVSMATVGLNPMITGTGTNLKLVEYFASGLPVVSTPIGARGIDAEDFVHLRIQSIEHFVQGIRHVIANPEEAAEQAKAARALVEARYDWATLGAVMEQRILAALAAGHGAALQGLAEPA
jgi:glycosyltransferase involved in cell wall biosynthesis